MMCALNNLNVKASINISQKRFWDMFSCQIGGFMGDVVNYKSKIVIYVINNISFH